MIRSACPTSGGGGTETSDLTLSYPSAGRLNIISSQHPTCVPANCSSGDCTGDSSTAGVLTSTYTIQGNQLTWTTQQTPDNYPPCRSGLQVVTLSSNTGTGGTSGTGGSVVNPIGGAGGVVVINTGGTGGTSTGGTTGQSCSSTTGQSCSSDACSVCIEQYCNSEAIAVYGSGYMNGQVDGGLCPTGTMSPDCLRAVGALNDCIGGTTGTHLPCGIACPGY
jgi:hypothetical protein